LPYSTLFAWLLKIALGWKSAENNVCFQPLFPMASLEPVDFHLEERKKYLCEPFVGAESLHVGLLPACRRQWGSCIL